MARVRFDMDGSTTLVRNDEIASRIRESSSRKRGARDADADADAPRAARRARHIPPIPAGDGIFETDDAAVAADAADDDDLEGVEILDFESAEERAAYVAVEAGTILDFASAEERGPEARRGPSTPRRFSAACAAST